MLHRSNYYKGEENNLIKTAGLCLCIFLSIDNAWAEECFTVPEVLPSTPAGWLDLQQSLEKDTTHCLRSSVFFALYGASQLNSGQLQGAIESLERALLLNENNGAALIDYSSALYHSGQIFSAIDLNDQLLARPELPAHLLPMLENRAQRWRESTTRSQQDISFQTGYDSNLNGATYVKNLTLNSPGGDIDLPISGSDRESSGRYVNFRANQQYIQQSAFQEKRFNLGTNIRLSEKSDTNYLQLSARYREKNILEKSHWYWEGSINYLHYDDESLSLITSASSKYQWHTQEGCQPYTQMSLDYLAPLQQDTLKSTTLFSGVGLNCQNSSRMFDAKLEHIFNYALDEERPGGNQRGWRVNLQWQKPLYKGLFSSNFRHTRLKDSSGYSSLLENGAVRRQRRTDFSMEYSQELSPGNQFNLLLSTQQQSSNIDLFKQRSTRFGIGFRKLF